MHLYEVLNVKLSEIDRDCEATARERINSIYSKAEYLGGRFRPPPFDEAANVWLQLIKDKGDRFFSEISRVLDGAQQQFDDVFFQKTTCLIEQLCDDHHYLERLNKFIEAVERLAARYGIQFDANRYRVDLITASYSAGVRNGLRFVRASIFAELARYQTCSRLKRERLSIDEIDSFSKVANIPPSDVSNLLKGGYWDVSEDFVQKGLEAILNVPNHKKDWGGEYNDLYTGNIVVNGCRLTAAFLLKGAGLRKKTLEIAECGKNGDQLVRLFESPAQIYVVQFVGEISEAVIKDVESKVRDKRTVSNDVWCCTVNGQDTARLLRAYGQV